MDCAKLRYYITIRGKNIELYGKALEISKSTLYRKMSRKTEFTREEIQKTISFLKLSDREIMEIFFKEKVS